MAKNLHYPTALLKVANVEIKRIYPTVGSSAQVTDTRRDKDDAQATRPSTFQKLPNKRDNLKQKYQYVQYALPAISLYRRYM
jgi:hypothetical protein